MDTIDTKPMPRKTVAIFVFVLLACALTSAHGVSEKIHPWVLKHTENDQACEFFVVLREQADLSPARSLSTKRDRGRFVYRALFDTAQQTQAPLRQWLDLRNIPYQSFHIVNAL